MKLLSNVLISLLSISPSVAFPQGVSPSLVSQVLQIQSDMLKELNEPRSTTVSFDAGKQFIDVSGSHAWAPPQPGDDRGPCPGLNALANHGYLPRNGVATIIDFIAATTTVFGMGIDLASILSVYGGVFDGQGLIWSIGGPGPLRGISGSHGHYESDNSPMRADLHQYGSDVDLVMSQFKTLYNLQPDAATANYDIDILSRFRAIRFNESIAKNPWFYYGPFAGTSVTQAAFSFIYRFFANHTSDYPDGILNQENLKSFFSISGVGDNMTWTPGWERIPDNWYRRSLDDPYGLNPFIADIGTFEKTTPALGSPGCNQGTVNSYVSINASYTGYNFTNPTDGVCFAIGSIVGVTNQVSLVGLLIQMLILPLQATLGCIQIPATNQTVIDGCPGYSFYGGPTGPVAPGAIQS